MRMGISLTIIHHSSLHPSVIGAYPQQSASSMRSTARRRRGACQACRDKKVRCDGKKPSCSECEKNGLECIPAPRTKKLGRPPGTRVMNRVPPTPSTASSSPSITTSIAETGELSTTGLLDTSEDFSGDHLDAPSGPFRRHSDTPSLNSSAESLCQTESTQLDAFYDVDFSTSWDLVTHDLDSLLLPSTNLDIPISDQVDKYAKSKAIPSNSYQQLSSVLLQTECRGRTDLISMFLLNIDKSRTIESPKSQEVEMMLRKLISSTRALFYSAPLQLDLQQTWNEQRLEGTQLRAYLSDFYNGSFDGPQLFIDRDFAEHVTDQVFIQHHSGLAYSALANAILTVCVFRRSQGIEDSTREETASAFFLQAMRAHDTFHAYDSSQDTLLHLQASAILLYCSQILCPSNFDRLLASAVQLSLRMRLDSKHAIQQTYSSSQEQRRAQQTFWFLYTLEKPYSMRTGISSMINDTCIDYSPQRVEVSTSSADRNDILDQDIIPLYEYATLCSNVIPQLYTGNGIRDAQKMESTISSLHTRFVAWRDSSLRALRYQSAHRFSPGSRSASHLEDSINIRYYELVLVLQGRWHCPGWRTFQGESSSLGVIQETVSDAVRSMSRLCSRDMFYEESTRSILFYLAVVVAGISFCDIYNKRGSEEDLARLGILLGYFGRSLNKSRGIFHQVLALVTVASEVLEQSPS
ncbi:Zn(2)-C6 fungal-type domain-containing protein [Fusarium falciforme]|uniref:Zn(2)-C6 fungal-type domain-containing protein n=1 Tax=Fusarium falciforme TaxID=195108 RepID=UPI0023019DD4|nr:Zn(2)-C6 fungal-type domain-containing protein [Fusarium falciforme]WAO93396.1 Zn(2)-C6 fungal-type domain-containing protein [Fusarium falciforme]